MTTTPWAMVSELAVDPSGAEQLEDAFGDRLGEVDGWPGFIRLEVWRDPRNAGRYLMVSWWETREAFSSWMHSTAHDRSHERIPNDPSPRPVRFDRYEVIAT
jgi:heme-degrading monooxygenase HmoA